MTRMLGAVALAIVVCAPVSTASAQLLAAKDGPVVYGHHHLNVTSLDAHRKFWVDTLGGTAVTIGGDRTEIIKFPNTFIFMRAQGPSGPTKGASVDHVGFSVSNLPAMIDRAKTNGYAMVTAEHAPPSARARPHRLRGEESRTIL